MKRRCVITGMGVVSPNGIGTAAFTEAALAGRSGVRRISRFDPSAIEVQIAGEVADFDELAWVDKKERKHVSRVLPIALCAASEALGNAGVDSPSLPLNERRRFGVIIGTGGGSQEFTEEQYRLYFRGQLSKMSLFCVPTGVMRFGEIREFLDSFDNLYLVGRNGMHRYNNQDHSMLTAMALGVFLALLYVSRHLSGADLWVLVAIYFIVLQFVMVTALALFFSSFSSSLLSAVFAFGLFVSGTFAEDLRGFAQMTHGFTRWLASGAVYAIPNFSALNVVSEVAHGQAVSGQLVFWNTAYAIIYTIAVLSLAILIFEYRNLK